MLKFIVIISVLFASAFATYDAYNNIVEYDVPLPIRRNSLSYEQHNQYHDNGQGRVVQPFYDGFLFPTVATAAVSNVAVTKISLIAKVATYALSLAKTFFAFILTNGLSLLIGSLAAIGVCKFTPVCDKLSSLQSVMDLQRDLTEYATPERIASATEFFKRTIREYRSLQD